MEKLLSDRERLEDAHKAKVTANAAAALAKKEYDRLQAISDAADNEEREWLNRVQVEDVKLFHASSEVYRDAAGRVVSVDYKYSAAEVIEYERTHSY